jgi:hypothetical protein
VYVQGTLVLGTLASTLVTVCLHYFGDLRSLLGAMASEFLHRRYHILHYGRASKVNSSSEGSAR